MYTNNIVPVTNVAMTNGQFDALVFKGLISELADGETNGRRNDRPNEGETRVHERRMRPMSHVTIIYCCQTAVPHLEPARPVCVQ